MKKYNKWRAKERQHLVDIAADCSMTDSEAAWKALLVIIANKDYEEESLTEFIENELDEGREAS